MTLAKVKVATVAVLVVAASVGVAIAAQPATAPSKTGTGAGSGQTTPGLTKDAIHAMCGRLEALNNLWASYSVESSYNPSRKEPADIGGDAVLVPKTGTERSERTFSRLGLRARWDIDWILPEDADRTPFSNLRHNPIQKEIYSFTGDSQEQLSVTRNHGPGGMILDRAMFQPSVLEAALGIRPRRRNSYFSVDEISRMEAENTQDGAITLTWRDDQGEVQQWTVKPELGYAVTAVRSGNVWITAEDFEAVDGLMVPKSVVFQLRVREGEKTRLVEDTRLKVHQYKLNDPENTESRYHITWPKGTDVRDMRLGINLVADEKGALIRNR